MTTHRDPQGRPTVFDHLPDDMPRVVSIGRLDINSEGLLLLTNDGGLARMFELPSTGWVRRYRVRAFGSITQEELDTLANGITVERMRFGPIDAKLEHKGRSNVWIAVSLCEGKNREVRRALEASGLRVNRLIRISYGPFHLGKLGLGAVEEVSQKVMNEQFDHSRGSSTSQKSNHSARKNAGGKPNQRDKSGADRRRRP
jgi:23S rRNA pseudouridine2605 synthase